MIELEPSFFDELLELPADFQKRIRTEELFPVLRDDVWMTRYRVLEGVLKKRKETGVALPRLESIVWSPIARTLILLREAAQEGFLDMKVERQLTEHERLYSLRSTTDFDERVSARLNELGGAGLSYFRLNKDSGTQVRDFETFLRLGGMPIRRR